MRLLLAALAFAILSCGREEGPRTPAALPDSGETATVEATTTVAEPGVFTGPVHAARNAAAEADARTAAIDSTLGTLR